MKKLLHERLKEHAQNKALEFEGEGYSLALWYFEAAALAEEIERYYIRRPRFEDGEPVQFGDEIVNTDGVKMICSAIHCYEDEVRLNDHNNPYYSLNTKYDNPIKRPQQTKPDSLERLRDDISMYAACEGGHVEEDVERFAERLSILIKNGGC